MRKIDKPEVNAEDGAVFYTTPATVLAMNLDLRHAEVGLLWTADNPLVIHLAITVVLGSRKVTRDEFELGAWCGRCFTLIPFGQFLIEVHVPDVEQPLLCCTSCGARDENIEIADTDHVHWEVSREMVAAAVNGQTDANANPMGDVAVWRTNHQLLTFRLSSPDGLAHMEVSMERIKDFLLTIVSFQRSLPPWFFEGVYLDSGMDALEHLANGEI